MTVMDLDIDMGMLESLDFNPDIACEAKKCDSEAKWIARNNCCGKQILLCDSHKVDTVEFVVRAIAERFAHPVCKRCNHAFRDAKLVTDVMLVTEI